MTEDQFDFEGTPVTFYRVGDGPTLLMLHGSGPGASSVGNWSKVMGPLARDYQVLAMDLIGFGKSGRKPQPPFFDYDLWLRQAEALLDLTGQAQVGVIGHSLSGSLALRLAASDSRVAALMTTGTMGKPFVATDATRRTWKCPRNREELVRALSGLIHDTSVIDEAYLRAREPVIFAPGYADYFDQMFEGDPAEFIAAAALADDEIASIQQPVLLLHGHEDPGFPSSMSISLAGQLTRGELVLLRDCSHSIAFERSETFLALARDFFGRALKGN
ncbi:Alpha/beta hydrolase [Caballeronia udeis]|uniref:Alpha/beta hydrolase n=1 Tax=Caballeronia udeis TaxID=1232866 RepID=A0A158JP47_9BURK|nr:alpha/beta hydrolase [Caballeronia udeis]SAL70548.1 Alpha/beta hydrolase [Caballeronia udeis]